MVNSLLIVQPLLDAGGLSVAGKGKNTGAGQESPFSDFLKEEVATRDARSAAEAENEEGSPDASLNRAVTRADGQKTASAKDAVADEEPDADSGEDASSLGQFATVSAVGAYVVPLEPAVPQDSERDVAEEAGLLPQTRIAWDDRDTAMVAKGNSGLAAQDETEPKETGEEEVVAESVFKSVGDVAPGNGRALADTPADDMKTDAVSSRRFDASATAADIEASAVQAAQQSSTWVQTQPAQVADPITSRVMQAPGTPDWGHEIGQRVLWMVNNAQNSVSLALNPPELGPLRVVVSVSNNEASAHFTSASPEVRHALEGSLPRLREMLEEAGVQLGQAHVGSGDTGQHASHQADHPRGGSASLAESRDTTADLEASLPVGGRASRAGLVDTFV
ncbi:MAG: flagellar hook-length control protein FliK [Burkholderiaceae bacterium]|jgi:flagellar hook-length control protein FliK|nr:flagellar hook-length control protein FliK [Burkholderiaceae bacterium]